MHENPHVPAPYSCQTILFRAIPYPGLIRKNGEHKPNIFFRRQASDPHGISLVDSIHACKDAFGSPISGVRSVHVGAMLGLNADLWLFPEANDDASHANIRFRNGDLTPRLVDNDPECRNIADNLMRISRPVPYWNEEGADERFVAEVQAKRAARISN